MVSKSTLNVLAVTVVLFFLAAFFLLGKFGYATWAVVLAVAALILSLLVWAVIVRNYYVQLDQDTEQRLIDDEVLLAMMNKVQIERVNMERAVLAVCLDKIESQIKPDEPDSFRWEIRRNFCLKFMKLLETESNGSQSIQLTQEQIEHVLNHHPLLDQIENYPPDPATDYVDSDWYRALKSQAQEFAQRLARQSRNG